MGARQPGAQKQQAREPLGLWLRQRSPAENLPPRRGALDSRRRTGAALAQPRGSAQPAPAILPPGPLQHLPAHSSKPPPPGCRTEAPPKASSGPGRVERWKKGKTRRSSPVGVLVYTETPAGAAHTPLLGKCPPPAAGHAPASRRPRPSRTGQSWRSSPPTPPCSGRSGTCLGSAGRDSRDAAAVPAHAAEAGLLAQRVSAAWAEPSPARVSSFVPLPAAVCAVMCRRVCIHLPCVLYL